MLLVVVVVRALVVVGGWSAKALELVINDCDSPQPEPEWSRSSFTDKLVASDLV